MALQSIYTFSINFTNGNYIGYHSTNINNISSVMGINQNNSQIYLLIYNFTYNPNYVSNYSFLNLTNIENNHSIQHR